MKLSKGIIAVFVCSWLYWIYLILNSQMILRFDALGYRDLGAMIHSQGWQQYFITGPNREPFYPAMISLSMDVASHFQVSYEMVMKTFQVTFLFISQWLMLILMRRMQIRSCIQVAILLYMGFSPALVNSALSLFSEIATYPFVLLIVYSLSESILTLARIPSYQATMKVAFLTAVAFLGAAFCKGIFQYIFDIWMLGVVGACLWTALRKQYPLALRIFTYAVICSVAVSVPITAFKKENQKFNGNYTFTNRYADLLFGNAYKRAQPLTGRIFMAHLASIPGGGVCRKFFSDQECQYCEFFAADYYRAGPLVGELGNVSKEDRDSKIIKLSIQHTLAHPFQYMIFMGIESLRMFFWESTQIGFVEYPPLLSKLFNFFLFKDVLRFCMSFLTIAVFFLLLKDVFAKREEWFNFQKIHNPALITEVIIIAFIIAYIGMHSFFSIITRYALPIVPLYFLTMAYVADRFLFKEKV
jgi:hypothetical protein